MNPLLIETQTNTPLKLYYGKRTYKYIVNEEKGRMSYLLIYRVNKI